MVFGAGLIVVLATMASGAFAGVTLVARLADDSFLAAAVPEDGLGAFIVGGLTAGGLLGLMLPLILLGSLRGNATTPRLSVGEAVGKLLLLGGICTYLLVVALVAAQLGRLLPEELTTLLGVFVVGFSWVPLALFPWRDIGLGGIVKKPLRPTGSDEPQ
ncbi:hypothetical protein ACIQ6Y_38300 [Streptomyces sp. NPDC096205]|uniref:hypothetical protein n=1 Tax=Streptomyces sp. NPDC096205 TaxID=3366081 RepID=UPI0038082C63